MKSIKIISKLNAVITFAITVLLGMAAVKFIGYNNNIIKSLLIFSGAITASFIIILETVKSDFKTGREVTVNRSKKIIILLMGILASVFIVMTFINSAVVDYFQPFSLYDNVIYLSIVSYVLVILRLCIEIIKMFVTSSFNRNTLHVVVAVLVIILTLSTWNLLQGDFEYENIEGDAYHVFEAGEGGYDIFRIPTILVIPAESTLENDTVLDQDIVIVMAEARRNGSSDHGDIDLVQKRSTDGGSTWSELEVVRQWESGIGKIGNSTPVFDQTTGKINLLHIAGEKPADYKTYTMESSDGGITWTEATLLTEGIVGPGHGIQIHGGPYDQRLVVPGYKDGGSYVLYSDDHGETWLQGEQFDDGNECEVTQVNAEGKLMIAVRTIHPVSQPHEKFHKLFAFSDDGGATWTDLKENTDLKEPVCMSSVVMSSEGVYYSYPNDYYSRSNMTIAESKDAGQNFESLTRIYQGPAGYSDLGVSSENKLFLVFENGAVEYDERITFVKIK